MNVLVLAVMIALIVCPSSSESLGIGTREFTCSPLMQKCYTDIIAEQWKAAKEEIGNFVPPKEYAQVFMRMLSFYRNKLQLYTTREKAPLFYAGILKTASETLNLNFIRHFGRPLEFHESKEAAAFRYNESNVALYKGYEEEFFHTFAFVRDPLQRFYSAMTEVFYRTWLYGGRSNYTIESIDSYTMEQYLETWFSGNQDDYGRYTKRSDPGAPVMFQNNHLAFASTIFFHHNITIVKHLESFRHDWKALENQLHFTLTLNHSIGAHEQTAIHEPFSGNMKNDDNFHVHSRLHAVFKTKPQYLRGFCHMYLIDYACFPEYALPEACHGLNDTVVSIRDQLSSCGALSIS